MNLESIIEKEESREIFEKYIGNISCWGKISSIDHPQDNQKLDLFIKHYSKHNDKLIDYSLLKKWLINKKRLSENDAQKCIDHIRRRWKIT